MKQLIIAIVVAALSGCVTEADVARISAQDDATLCINYMDYPNMNVYNSTRLAEIRKRKLDCNIYGNVAERKAAAEGRLVGALNRAGSNGRAVSAPPPAQSQPRPVSNTTLQRTEEVIGARLCHYSDGSVVRIGGGMVCPRTN